MPGTQGSPSTEGAAGVGTRLSQARYASEFQSAFNGCQQIDILNSLYFNTFFKKKKKSMQREACIKFLLKGSQDQRKTWGTSL